MRSCLICPLRGVLSTIVDLVAVQLVNTWKQTQPNCQGVQASFMLQCKPVSGPRSWRDRTERVSWQVSVKLEFHTRQEIKSISGNTNKETHSRNMKSNMEKTRMRTSQSTVSWDSLGSAESGLCFAWSSDSVFIGHGSLSAQVRTVVSPAEADGFFPGEPCSSPESEH